MTEATAVVMAGTTPLFAAVDEIGTAIAMTTVMAATDDTTTIAIDATETATTTATGATGIAIVTAAIAEIEIETATATKAARFMRAWM